MKILLTILLTLQYALSADLYSYQLTSTKGKEIKLADYKKGPILLVNIATRCGYTGQLDDLEKLHQKYHKQGLTVVGIPSNDFMGQTPEGNKKIDEFCRLKYGVSFPLTEKVVVKGDKKIDLIKDLIKSSGSDSEIGWNFEKFVVAKGKVVGRFKSSVEPLDKKITQLIEKHL